MALSDYDRAHVADILHGAGSWWSARLLRALDELLAHADATNQHRLMEAFPEECAIIFRHYGRGSDASEGE